MWSFLKLMFFVEQEVVQIEVHIKPVAITKIFHFFSRYRRAENLLVWNSLKYDITWETKTASDWSKSSEKLQADGKTYRGRAAEVGGGEETTLSYTESVPRHHRKFAGKTQWSTVCWGNSCRFLFSESQKIQLSVEFDLK